MGHIGIRGYGETAAMVCGLEHCELEHCELEVHWITYKCRYGITEFDGEQGWATVCADDYDDWIYYGPDGLEQAMFQAGLTNRNPTKVIGKERAVIARYRPNQWMGGASPA